MTRRGFFHRTIGALVAAMCSPLVAATDPMAGFTQIVYIADHVFPIYRITCNRFIQIEYEDGHIEETAIPGMKPWSMTVNGHWDDYKEGETE